MSRVLVVQHESACPPGRLGTWLRDAGAELDVVRPDRGEALPSTVGHDGLVVLGGMAGANDDHRWSWLPATRALLADAVDRAVPTLGVCLGHQLLAVATGGRVDVNPAGLTAGLRDVAVADDHDPLLGELPADARSVHWNADVVVDLPPDAQVLARTADGAPQAVKIGRAAWGVQFHPEVDAEIVSVWAARGVARGRLTDAEAAERMAAITAADDDLARTWRPVVSRFAALLA